MRRLAILAFWFGVILYPVSFLLTVNAVSSSLAELPSAGTLWLAGRVLVVLVVALFAFSVVAAFFTTERAKRIWWAVPATVLAIAVTYFDLVGFGFTLSR